MTKYHYDDVIMGTLAYQITSLTIVYSTVYSGADQSKHQSSESLAFVWGIHRGPVNSPHKWPVTRKMFPSDDVIMITRHIHHFAVARWFHSIPRCDSATEVDANPLDRSLRTRLRRNGVHDLPSLRLRFLVIPSVSMADFNFVLLCLSAKHVTVVEVVVVVRVVVVGVVVVKIKQNSL